MEPVGFTLMRVEIVIVGQPHYDKQQVVFVLDDPSVFSARIPVILGTPTINRVIQTMKETEMHKAPSEWQAARVAFEWTQGFQFRTSLAERLKFLTNTAQDPLELGEKVLLTDKCTMPGFQSVVAHSQTQNTMMGHRLNVMMEAPYLGPDDKADLPNGFYVMRTYTELKDGSWSVSVVLRNLTARPIHLARRWRVMGQVVAANAV